MADHDPGGERIAKTNIEGDTAIVETHTDRHGLDTYWEYALRRKADGDWRIVSILRFLDAEGAPLVSPDDRAILDDVRADAVLGPVPDAVEPNCDALFVDGREVTRFGETTTTRVRSPGALVALSGILGVRDFGYDGYGFAPLARSVPPGTHPITIVEAFGRVAAVRVRFREGTPVKAWHPATTHEGNGVVGVDAGNIAIFDARVREHRRSKARASLRCAYLRASARDEARATVRWTGTPAIGPRGVRIEVREGKLAFVGRNFKSARVTDAGRRGDRGRGVRRIPKLIRLGRWTRAMSMSCARSSRLRRSR